MPYGQYTVHQTRTVNDAEFVSDFDVLIDENGKTYEYVLNDTPFSSYIQVEKLDAETGKQLPAKEQHFRFLIPESGSCAWRYRHILHGQQRYADDSECLPRRQLFACRGKSTGKAMSSTAPVPFTVNAGKCRKRNAAKVIFSEKSDTAQKGRICSENRKVRQQL